MEPLPETPVEMTQEQREQFVKRVAENLKQQAQTVLAQPSSKLSTETPESSPTEPEEEETPSSRKEFEDFKRRICGVRPLWAITFGEIDTLLLKEPMDLALKLKKAHLRAIQQKKKNSKIQQKVEFMDEKYREGLNKTLGFVDDARQWSDILYEQVIRNDTTKNMLMMTVIVGLLAFFAPFGVIYLGVQVGKGLKAAFPQKFGWIPL